MCSKKGMGRGRKITIIFSLLFWCIIGRAELEITDTLPKGIYSSKVIFGTYSGLDQKFNADGLVQGVADQYHIKLSGKNLAAYDPQFKKLLEGLDKVAPGENLGSRISGGTLTFKAQPNIDYFVPTLGYGITPNLSIGIGIPIVHFRNTLQASAQGNVAAMNGYIHGGNPDVDRAMTKAQGMASNLQGSVNGILNSRGYKPIQNADFVAPGDLQVSAIYRYYESDLWRLALRPYIQLPTGRPDDPDDLVDIATGDQPAIGLYSIHELQVSRRWALVSSVGYQFNIEDSQTVRVPVDGDDTLPSLDREETVSRRTGDSIFLEGGFSYYPYKPFEIRVVYDFTDKAEDWYQGDHPTWNYSLLATDTASQIHQIRAQLEFSTVDYYMQKTFSVPFKVGYVFADTIYAVDAPDDVTNQLYMRMFF
jgi:hypothetical protein